MNWEVKSVEPPSRIIITDGKRDVTILAGGDVFTDYGIDNPITFKRIRVKVGDLTRLDTVRMMSQCSAVDEDLAELIETMISNMYANEGFLWESFNCIRFDNVVIDNIRSISVTNDNPLGYPESDDRTLVTISCGNSKGLSKIRPTMGRKNAQLMFILDDNLVQLNYAMLTGIDINQEYDETKCELNFYSRGKVEILSAIDRPKQEKIIEIPQPNIPPSKPSLLKNKPRILDLD